MVMILLGNGVVANVVLKDTKGNGGGLIVIAFGWAAAVFIPVLMFGPSSGAFFNPALTIAFAAVGQLHWWYVFGFVVAQMIGAALGATLVYVYYKSHFDITKDEATKKAAFCTEPAIRNFKQNFISEFLGTFILAFTILGVGQSSYAETGTLGAIGVFVIILSIGVSLGGTTGYAINPARDLGPRVAYALLPIKNKGSVDWEYAWIPVVAPIIGAFCGAFFAIAIFP
jgi:glycerol uptake facilitator protein